MVYIVCGNKVCVVVLSYGETQRKMPNPVTVQKGEKTITE